MKQLLLVLLLTITLVLTGCKGEDPDDGVIEVAAIILNGNEMTLQVGDSETFEYDIRPSDATFQELECNTGDSAVATCSNFRIYGNGVGTTTITIEAINGVDAKITVTVTE